MSGTIWGSYWEHSTQSGAHSSSCREIPAIRVLLWVAWCVRVMPSWEPWSVLRFQAPKVPWLLRGHRPTPHRMCQFTFFLVPENSSLVFFTLFLQRLWVPFSLWNALWDGFFSVSWSWTVLFWKLLLLAGYLAFLWVVGLGEPSCLLAVDKGKLQKTNHKWES